MCLFTNQQMAKVAKKDIVCYKVVKRRCDGIYETPFRHTPLGKTLDGKQEYGLIVYNNWSRSGFGTISRDNIYEDKPKFSYVVEDGAIHSYKKLSGAKRLVKFFTRRGFEDEYHIFECIIPAGSDYYVGKENADGTGFICYASGCIKFVERIK